MDLTNLVLSIVRNKLLLLVSVVCTFALGTLLILMLPNVYESSSKILIERPNTYETTGVPVVSDNMSQRMHAIIASVTSNANVRRIIEKNRLAEDATDEAEMYKAIDDFKEQAQILFDNVPVINPVTGKPAMYSMGLAVQFEHSDPEVAYTVAQQLTNDVLQANSGKGQKSAEFRQSFLNTQTEKLAAELSEVDKKIAVFKEEHSMYLPELHPVAVRRLSDVQSQIERTQDNIDKLRREAASSSEQLATVNANTNMVNSRGEVVIGPAEELRNLEVQYAKALTKYSSEHPDLQRLEKQIQGLKQVVRSNDTSALEIELSTARQRLAKARETYSDIHPDVQKLQRQVDTLLAARNEQANNAPRASSQSSNPAYLRMLSSVQRINSEIAREEQRYDTLRLDLTDIREQLERMPFVEQQLTTLERTRQSAQNAYTEVQNDLTNAQLGANMQEADLLERFVLTEPPVKPFEPSSPRREILLPVLAVLSFGIGLLVVLIKHILEDRLLRSRDLEAIIDAPVLLVPNFR